MSLYLMMSQCNCHCEVTKPSLWYVWYILLLIKFMSWNWHKYNWEGSGVFVMFIYFCFFFFFFCFLFFFFVCLFQFLDSPSQKFTLSNFDQEVACNQYLYLYQEFMFVVCFFVYLSACFWCLDYSRTNEQIFIKNLWVGPLKGRNY